MSEASSGSSTTPSVSPEHATSIKDLVKKFLAINLGKKKIILLGEEHAGDGLVENVGKQISVLNTLDSNSVDYVIYSELPFDMISHINNKFTAFYLKKEAKLRGKQFNESKVTLTCRTSLGTCDDLYETDVKSHSTDDKVVVAAVGLLHAAGMNFSSDFAILRLNCTTKKATDFAISELNKRGKTPLSNLLKMTTPYIDDSSSIALGHETLIKHSREVLDATSDSTFEPNWVISRYGHCVIKCPICLGESGILLKITHSLNCPNKNKRPNFSNKNTECTKLGATGGGNRKTRRKKHQKNYRSHKRYKSKSRKSNK